MNNTRTSVLVNVNASNSPTSPPPRGLSFLKQANCIRLTEALLKFAATGDGQSDSAESPNSLINFLAEHPELSSIPAGIGVGSSLSRKKNWRDFLTGGLTGGATAAGAIAGGRIGHELSKGNDTSTLAGIGLGGLLSYLAARGLFHTNEKRAIHPTLQALIQAKAESDTRHYRKKQQILRSLIAARPKDFYIDSENDGIVGLTHRSGFRIHTTRDTLPVELEKRLQNVPQRLVA